MLSLYQSGRFEGQEFLHLFADATRAVCCAIDDVGTYLNLIVAVGTRGLLVLKRRMVNLLVS